MTHFDQQFVIEATERHDFVEEWTIISYRDKVEIYWPMMYRIYKK